MDHIGIISNAFKTTIRYRALWILGFLWFLVGGGLSSGSPGSLTYTSGSSSGAPFGGTEWEQLGLDPLFAGAMATAIASWLLLACCIFLLLAIIITVVRYVIQAGVYRSLSRLELEGEEPTVGDAFRQGWHRHTWRLFLQNLLVIIVLALTMILLGLIVAAPLLLLVVDNDAANAVGIGGTVVLGLCWALLLFAALIAVNVLSQLWWRAAVIADQSTIDAMVTAWRMARHNLSDLAIIWLLMLGIGILFAFLMIPFVFILALLTVILAGGPGYLIYQITGSVAGALLWGIPVGLVVIIIPIAIVGGLYLIFYSSVWNQVYTALSQRLAQPYAAPSSSSGETSS